MNLAIIKNKIRIFFDYIIIFFTEDNLKKRINYLIQFVFFILIISSLIYASKGILMSIYKYGFAEVDDSSVLKVVEYILFYLLPLFFLLGLNGFYNNAIQNIFLPKQEQKDPDVAIKTFNITKNIFLSSVLSYVIVKVIEIIFYEKDISTITWKEIIIYSSLIILLMLFIIFYNTTHSNQKKEIKNFTLQQKSENPIKKY